ncbi:hypothetical protein O1G22_40760 [Streptomyces camelliae]|uniref:Uncharacterized protein n=1 Tax=Streptomyces camelliae TaxID=3004093 RepID=A0ABY7PE92_9ACTN|nr:hypothetical protein [Streptomyces sp. HUAS 2-6]WBO68692.1 hypothetical protein O1G22_40760 [Streptomyces sp. HUAS 2-6]
MFRYLLAPRGMRRGDRTALTLFAATCLPLVVAVTITGVSQKVLARTRPRRWSVPRCSFVLVLPLLAVRARARRAPEKPASLSPAESEAW